MLLTASPEHTSAWRANALSCVHRVPTPAGNSPEWTPPARRRRLLLGCGAVYLPVRWPLARGHGPACGLRMVIYSVGPVGLLPPATFPSCLLVDWERPFPPQGCWQRRKREE